MDDEGQRVVATFLPSYAERVKAEAFLLFRNPLNLLPLLLFPAAGIGLITLLLRHPESTPGLGWYAALMALGFSPGMFFWNSYRSHRMNIAQGPVTYEIDSEGIHTSVQLIRSCHRWPAIHRVRASRGLVFFNFNKRCAHFVPKRAFSGSGSLAIVKRLAEAGGVPRVEI